eukprot:UN05660
MRINLLYPSYVLYNAGGLFWDITNPLFREIPKPYSDQEIRYRAGQLALNTSLFGP